MGREWKRKYKLLLETQQNLMSELSMAAKVQQGLLPDLQSVHLPENIELGVISVAAREVSGDFYNLLPYDQGILLAVADVSGKSVPAAIMMSMIKFGMDSVIDTAKPPHVIMRQLNRFVHRTTVVPMFVSMILTEYNLSNNTLHYCSAGHEPALIYHASEGIFNDLTTEGMVLGLSLTYEYETKKVQLAPGDFVVLYTDGVIEDRGNSEVDNNNMLRRFLQDIDLKQHAQKIVEQLHHKILKSKHIQVIQDDQTIVILKRNV